jgi:hypothetical protein
MHDAPYQREIQKLDAQIEEHKAVKLMVTEMEKRQVEYDHYVEKLRNMSFAPGDRLAANEHKRKVAQEQLDSCTSSLVRVVLRASVLHVASPSSFSRLRPPPLPRRRGPLSPSASLSPPPSLPDKPPAVAAALTWGGDGRKPMQTSALEKTLEAAPVNMARLMAAVFAAEAKATVACNAAFGEMLEEPPQWMSVVANKHPEMAEAIATAGSIASAAVSAAPELNAEVARLRDQNKQLKEELANLKVSPLLPALVVTRPVCAGAAALCYGRAPTHETSRPTTATLVSCSGAARDTKVDR